MNCSAEHTTSTRPAKAPRSWRRVNITPVERVGRIAIGTVAAAVGLASLAVAGSLIALILYLLLAAAGIDLIVTGAIGHCPLYQKLGYVPRSLRATQ